MELEITPEPSADERAAIVAALAEETREEVPAPPPLRIQELAIGDEDSVKP